MNAIRGVLVIVLTAVLMIGSSVTAQDDLKSLVKKGQSAFDAKDYQSALEYFQQVVQKLQNLVGAAFEQYMPKALPGWEAGELQRQSWAGTSEEFTGNMVNLSQKFTRTSDGKTCRIDLVNWPQSVTAVKQSLDMYKQMGDMMNADPNINMSINEKDGWTVLRIVDLQQNTTQIQAVSNNAMISIDANYPDAKEANQYLDAMDLSAIEHKAKRPASTEPR
jgi:hypothetical protein